MKKLIISVAMSLTFALAANAQQLPFGEYLKYTPEQLKEAGFKFRSRWNKWFPKATAFESNDYAPVIALGKNGEIAEIGVYLHPQRNEEVIKSVRAFMQEYGKNLAETTDEYKGERYVTQTKTSQCEYEQYTIIMRENLHTDNKDDSSFTSVGYTIRTGVERWSRVTERWQRKRDRKAEQEHTTPTAE